jgi:hypothetical protein
MLTPDNSTLLADAFTRALTPAPETVAFYTRLKQALAEIDAEEALHDMSPDEDPDEKARA